MREREKERKREREKEREKERKSKKKERQMDGCGALESFLDCGRESRVGRLYVVGVSFW